MISPIGFSMDQAVVSWIAESQTSSKQARAQIIVALDPEMTNVIYTSDPQASPESTGVKLPLELKPCTAYYWTVQVWGDAGDTAVSEVNYFETGKMGEALGGEWITTPWEDRKRTPYVRKQFSVAGNIKKARLYMTGLGIYRLEVNGQKQGNDFFAPGCNAMDRWVQIYTYDLTDSLHTGANVLGVMLGDGWAKGRYGCSEFARPYVNDFLLKAELRLELEDGSTQVITTDDTWKCTPSPVISSCIYDGVVFDENKVIPDWSASGCNEENWDYMVTIKEVTIGRLEDRLSLPVIIKEQITPVELITTPAGELVLDMGQNMVGWVRIRVHEPAGTRIRLSHGEILQNDCFYRDNLRSAKAEYTYISDGTEKYAEPVFTFFGFRYVKLEGFTQQVNLDDFIGCVVYSDLEETGWFTTSDERINRLFQNAKWSQKDNFLDVPTDCPQRDERMGWTGDAQVFCKTASYNMDTYAFYTKYLHDFWKEQEKNYGMAPHVVPSMIHEATDKSGGWHGGSCAWGDAATIMPWTLYNHYDDVTILERQYPSMKAWVDWIVRTGVGKTGLWDSGFQYADWLALDGKSENDTFGGTDPTYVATAYLKYSAELTAKAAAVLGQESDVAYYQQISQNAKAALQKAYFTEDGRCVFQTQTAQVLALEFELTEPDTRKIIIEDLIRILQKSNMHLQTGFVGTAFLCKALSDEGCSEAAYQILFQDDFPSWLYEVKMGATTIWERWNSVLPDGRISSTGMNSLNHYAYGSIACWMYENICGLKMKERGFKSFYVKPEFTDRFDYVDMKYNSPKGVIEIKWEKKETSEITEQSPSAYRLHVKVPFDTTAIVELPGQGTEALTLLPGEYEI